MTPRRGRRRAKTFARRAGPASRRLPTGRPPPGPSVARLSDRLDRLSGDVSL